MKTAKSLIAASVIAAVYCVNIGALADTPLPESHTRIGDAPSGKELNFEPVCNGPISMPTKIKSEQKKVVPPHKSPLYPLSLPEYPEASKQAGEEGTVMVQLFVTEQGLIAKSRVAQSSGSQGLDDAAIQGTRYWRFVPARIADAPVCMWVAVPVVFKLPKDNSPPVK